MGLITEHRLLVSLYLCRLAHVQRFFNVPATTCHHRRPIIRITCWITICRISILCTSVDWDEARSSASKCNQDAGRHSKAVNKQTDTSHVNDGTTCLPLFEMCRTGGTSRGALCPALIPYARSACTRHRRPPGPRPFSGTSQRNSTLCCAARPAGPARETTNGGGERSRETTLLDLACTLPKLPLPSTARKWKSSTVYFLKRGIEVAGAVIRPDRWYWAYVYEVSKYIHNWTH